MPNNSPKCLHQFILSQTLFIKTKAVGKKKQCPLKEGKCDNMNDLIDVMLSEISVAEGQILHDSTYMRCLK